MPSTAEAAALPPARGATPAPAYTLTRQRVYILPTRPGLGFATVATVMLIGAINYNNSLGYLLTFLLASLVLVSMLHTYRNLAGLRLTLRAGKPVFAQETASYTLSLDNRRQPARHDLIVGYEDEQPDGKGTPRIVRRSIEADTIARVTLEPRPLRRGWHSLGRVTVASRYPFGLFRAWSTFHSPERLLVYPRPAADHDDLPAHGSREGHVGGLKGQGNDDFSGLRRYVPGDSPRRIHWKSLAREQETSVKMFGGAAPAEVVLRWDDTHGDDVEARLSTLCGWVQSAESRQLPYRLELPEGAYGPQVGGAHHQSCLRALALHGLE